MQIRVTESVLKTDYANDVNEYNIGDYIDIDSIEGIDDKFIGLYFEIQDNLDSIINNNDKYEDYYLYDIMKAINNVFYPPINDKETLFPFEVAVFLIKHGYKRYFLSDSYYLALLYETPEIYNRVVEDEYYRNNHNLTQELIHYHNDTINVSQDKIEKYKDYIVSPYSTEIDRTINLVNYKNKEFSWKMKFREYTDIYRGLMLHIKNILKIPGVCICGGSVNQLLYDVDEYFRENLVNDPKICPLDIDIFLYGEDIINDFQILRKVEEIIEIIYDMRSPLNMNIFHTDNSITIQCFDWFNDIMKFQIIKRVYKNISQILLGFDLDSSACSLYSENGKLLIGYLPRYKFAMENRINIINPFRQSSTYNTRLIKYTKRGYSIFIPGAIHLEENYIDTYKKYTKHTLQSLLCSIVRNNINTVEKYNCRIKNHSDYENFQNIKYIFNIHLHDNSGHNYSFREMEEMDEEDEYYNQDIKYYLKSLNESLGVDSTHEINDLLIYNLERYGEDFTLKKIYRNPYSIRFNSMEYLNVVLLKTKVHVGWIKQNPGTQISGTFNPTHYNYLSNYNLQGKLNEPKVDVRRLFAKPENLEVGKVKENVSYSNYVLESRNDVPLMSIKGYLPQSKKSNLVMSIK